MRPLPEPVAGGSLKDLKPFMNFNNEDEFNLNMAWLTGVFRPSGPYPVGAFNGEHGTAKSTNQKIDRALVDPNYAPVRSYPKEELDLRNV